MAPARTGLVKQPGRATLEIVLHNTYEGQACSIARTLELVGERWTLLILRDAFLGVRRFDDFQRSLGIARNVLNTRLQRLVESGLLEKRRYQERPERFEYRLTEMGLDLWPVTVALMEFGDRHLAGEEGPPTVLEHRGCGGHVTAACTCSRCAAQLTARDVRPVPGPGAPRAPVTATR
jgi:DNA-binding HxlR family transcriptional regulator